MDAISTSHEREAIRQHLGDVQEHENKFMISGFRQALNEARTATGRNEKGEILEEHCRTPWLSALCYMALLDQIGSCFKRKGVPDTFPRERNNGRTPDFKKTLYRFGVFEETNDDEKKEKIDALYALRCSFAHDFALANRYGNTYNYWFGVSYSSEGPMIKLPEVPCDGRFENKSRNNTTYVNLQLFGDFVENICAQLFELAERDGLEILLDDGADELIGRYWYGVTRPITPQVAPA